LGKSQKVNPSAVQWKRYRPC